MRGTWIELAPSSYRKFYFLWGEEGIYENGRADVGAFFHLKNPIRRDKLLPHEGRKDDEKENKETEKEKEGKEL